jgi:hypothetical protein
VFKIECYGWVPSLSGNILIEEPFVNLGPINQINPTYSATRYLALFSNNLFKYKSLNDEKPKIKTTIIYSFDGVNPYPVEMSFFKEKDFEFVAKFRILEFLEKGLIKIEIYEFNPVLIQNHNVKASEAEKMLLKQAFFDLRDMFHKQTHTISNGDKDEYPDSLTQPSFKTIKLEAIKEIIHFHQQKVHLYNNFNLGLKTKSQQMRGDKNVLFDSTLIRTQAKGCFIYALNFIEFYGKDLSNEEREFFKTIFNNAIAAMEAFCEEIDTYYNVSITESLRALAILSILMGSAIVTLAVINVSFSDPIKTNAPLLWMSFVLFLVFIVLCYISVINEIKILGRDL